MFRPRDYAGESEAPNVSEPKDVNVALVTRISVLATSRHKLNLIIIYKEDPPENVNISETRIQMREDPMISR